MVETPGTQRPPDGSARSAPFYRPELDTLRFFAFLAVFITHTCRYPAEFFLQHHSPAWLADALPKIIRSGAYGVDLFFALSAYLITELLLREKEQRGALDVKAFYVRRILRIWPLYYFLLAVAFAVPFFNPGGEFSPRHLTMFTFMAGNWSMKWFGWSAGPIAIPLWSVSVEEQFYLFWPPIVAKLSRSGIAIAACILIVIANVDRFWQLTLHATPLDLWPDTFGHLDSIGAGILVSLVLQGRSPSIGRLGRIAMIGLGATGIFGVGWFVASIPDQPPITLATLAGYIIIVAACVSILVAFIGMELRFAPLAYLGKTSYGLYAYHVAIIFLVGKVSFLNHFGIKEVACLTLTIAVAAASYTLLESPFLRLKERFAHVHSRPV